MKRLFLLIAITFFLGCSQGPAATGFYRTGLTGGTSADVDGIPESSISDNELCLVADESADHLYHYRYDSSSALTENSPLIITPDDSTGNGRWILQTNYLDVSDHVKANRVLNSEMMIDQRNEGSAVTATGSYIVDRFKMSRGDTEELALSGQQATGIGGTRNSIKVTATTAETDWTDTSEYVAPFQHYFLGYDMADLVNGADVTISFYFMSNHPDNSVFSVALRAGDGGYSYVTDFTYTTTATAQLVTKTITIPAHASNYVSNTTDGIGMSLTIAAYTGTDYQGTVDQWNSANYMSSASATDWTQAVTGPADGYVQVSGVQMRVGDEYVELPRKTRAEYLAECLPYYQKSYEQGTAPGTATSLGMVFEQSPRNSADVTYGFTLGPEMVGIPDITVYSTATGASGKISNNGDKDIGGAPYYFSSGGAPRIPISTGTGDSASNASYQYTADAEL